MNCAVGMAARDGLADIGGLSVRVELRPGSTPGGGKVTDARG